MAKAIVRVGGRTSAPAATRNSLVDRAFLRPMIVRKVGGKGKLEEKAALVVVDGQFMVVAPTKTGEPAVYVGRKNADKYYTFVRWMTPQEAITFEGINDAPARPYGR